MFRLNKKSKLIIGVIAFCLLTPMIIFYILDQQGAFDTRSRAGLEQILSEKYQIADLNGDEKISVSDFGIWLKDFREYKEDSTSFSSISDLNEDQKIALGDFSLWLNLWREYKVDANRMVTINIPDPDSSPEVVEPADVPEDLEIVGSGGEITKDSGYTYHTFTEDGIFSIEGIDEVEVLIVGGGGGGGSEFGGGGGAGGVRKLTVSVSGNIDISVGKGGTTGMNGGDSSFGEQIALGGGGGASGETKSALAYYVSNGRNGASGGGGTGFYDSLYTSLGGLGTSGQGYAGADGYAINSNSAEVTATDEEGTISQMSISGYPPCKIGGGGGGAAGLGIKSNGGVGVSVWGKYYGGGGAGAKCTDSVYSSIVGGLGGLGGGADAPSQDGKDGFGGGGSGGNASDGGSGGDGIVIIRYMIPGEGIQIDDDTPSSEVYYEIVDDGDGIQHIIISGPPEPPAGYEADLGTQYYYEIVDDGDGIQHIIISGPPTRPEGY